jgi:hypothetical protein
MPPRIPSAPGGRARRRLRAALLLALAAVSASGLRTAAAPQAGAATGPDRFLAVKAWRLSWNAQAKQNDGNRQGSSSASGDAVLTLDDESEGAGIVEESGTWTGRGQVSGSGVFHEDRGNAGKHREGSGSIDARAELVVDIDARTYAFQVFCDDSVPGTGYDWRPGTGKRTYTDTIGLPCPGIAKQTLPANGTSLSGTHVHRNDADGIIVTTTWSLAPAGTEEYELLIEPAGDYDAWLPEGHLRDMPQEAPGANTIGFRVRFQKIGGGAPAQRPASFVFDLLDTTRETGVCLNYPARSSGSERPDLRFHEGDGRFSEVTDDGQHAVQESPEGLDFRLDVHSYDFGAHGKLSIKAVMAGGREILGRFVPTGQERIPIPRDDDGNRIADDWESRNGLRGSPADADDDAKPSGQASDGDGITLFEEYRGFVRLKGRTAERVHHRTDPNVKSLFVIDDENLFRPEDWADATVMESFRLTSDLVGAGTAGKPAARNATTFNRGYGKGPEFDYAIRLQTHGGTAGAAGQLGYAEIFPDIVDNPSQAEYVMVSPTRIRNWVERSMPQLLEKMYEKFRAGASGPIRDDFTARLVLDAQRELLTNPAIVSRVADRLVAKTVVHEVAHACGMYHHGVDAATMSAPEGADFTSGEKTCPTRYHENEDYLTIAVVETLFPRENGMILDSGKFCSAAGCWKKLKVREW